MNDDTGTYRQVNYPHAAAFETGNYVVTYDQWNHDNDGYAVVAGIFNSTGTKLTGDIQVNAYLPNYQRYPKVAILKDQHFVVAWASRGQALEDSYYDIYF